MIIDLNEPNFAGMKEHNRIQQKNFKTKEVELKPSGVLCEHCKEEIMEPHYYQCCYHGTIHCDKCAHNQYRRELKASEAAYCKNNYKKLDCIFELKYFDENPKK
jgi:hypothetical protein